MNNIRYFVVWCDENADPFDFRPSEYYRIVSVGYKSREDAEKAKTRTQNAHMYNTYDIIEVRIEP